MKGQCLCGDIEYVITGKIKSIINCHCNLCRRMNGAPMSSYAISHDDDFVLVKGTPAWVMITEKSKKHFCAKCITPLFNSNPVYDSLKIIHLGTLDDCQQLTPAVNIYCENELEWIAKVKQIPSFPDAIPKQA